MLFSIMLTLIYISSICIQDSPTLVAFPLFMVAILTGNIKFLTSYLREADSQKVENLITPSAYILIAIWIKIIVYSFKLFI
jgi:hypothetical protein